MKIDLKQIRQLAGILRREGIEEFEWREEEFYLRFQRATSAGAQVIEQETIMSEATLDKKDSQEKTDGPADGNRYIVSPIVGTFYRAPSPKSDFFVKEGDSVNKGQALCILEAMKLMNELEAEFPCKIVKILIENAQPVEYGEPLFEVKPM